MPVFLERFILPIFAALLIAVIVTNPMKFDNTQKISATLCLIFAAWFVAHTVHLFNKPTRTPLTPDTDTPQDSSSNSKSSASNQSSVKEQGAPMLEATIEFVGVGTPPPHDGHSTSITLVVSVRNTGTPSIAEDYALTVTMLKGKPLKTRPMFIPQQGIILRRDEGAPQRFSGMDALYNKTIQQPIVTGAVVKGVLVFVLEGVHKDDVYRRDTVLELTFTDVMKKEYKAFYSITTNDQGPAYIPGLQYIPPKKPQKSRRKESTGK